MAFVSEKVGNSIPDNLSQSVKAKGLKNNLNAHYF